MGDNTVAGPSGQADPQPAAAVAAYGTGQAQAPASGVIPPAVDMSLPPRDLPPPDYATAVSGCMGASALPRGYQPSVVDLPDEPPPEYSVAANLPSYDQAERSKNKFYEEDPIVIEDIESPSSRFPGGWGEDESDAALLGNDIVFCAAFVLAFLFNWVGFLLLMCFCHTIAARYGALAGFGLSLVKWTLIVKRSTELVRTENAWLWWLVLGFGFLICTRTCIQYLQIKKTWRHLSRSARERLFFFY
jgi:hypothetical protein